MAIIPNGRRPAPTSSSCWSFRTFSISFFAGLIAFAVMTFYIAHQSIPVNTTMSSSSHRTANFQQQQQQQRPSLSTTDNNNNNNNIVENSHPLAGLSCEAHGGPSSEQAKEMVYWQDIPSDRYVTIDSNLYTLDAATVLFDLLKILSLTQCCHFTMYTFGE